MGHRAAIFVLPIGTTGQQGPVAAWVSTAGWASAGRRLLGDAWIATPEGVLSEDETLRRGSSRRLHSRPPGDWRHRVPGSLKSAVKDVRRWNAARTFRVPASGPWDGSEVAFVWQRHELFHDAGLRLAADLDVPSVLFVPAPLVWESRRWGARRLGHRILETVGEQRALTAADVVACGSPMVADEVVRLGVPRRRIVVTPTGVDLDLFGAPQRPSPARRALGLDDAFVVGWTGSFRPFHALEQAISAVSKVEGAALLLVGDGPERPRIEELARRAGVRAVFTGTVDHGDLPDHLWAMDVAVVLAPPDDPFHYSPLKLAEYLAAGLPVIAPAAGELPHQLADGTDAVLVPPGDVAAMAAALTRLRDDAGTRERLAAAARVTAEERFSWDARVRTVLSALR
jgi:glycosyltransferase involved in cell wall biosynthesis